LTSAFDPERTARNTSGVHAQWLTFDTLGDAAAMVIISGLLLFD
jgi:hypothetical protein